MIPVNFSYLRPSTIQGVIECLATRDNSVIISGGQSLMTQLKWRSLRPDYVVDINKLPLNSIRRSSTGLVIEALVRQDCFYQVQTTLAEQLLARICDAAGDPLIRARGTFVGALCAAEPGGDWAAGALALDAVLNLEENTGTSQIDYDEWLSRSSNPEAKGLVVSVELQEPPADCSVQYRKTKHAAIGWSIASLASVRGQGYARLAVSGATERPCRLKTVENTLIDGGGDFQAALDADLSQLTFFGDSYASADYRESILRTMVLDAIHDKKPRRIN